MRDSRKGSVLVIALIVVGVMAFAIGAILLSIREFTRSTSDKVAYEEAYHTALGGIAATKSWLMDPALAKIHLGNTEGGKLELITSAALAVSNYVRANRESTTALGMSSSQWIAKAVEEGYNVSALSNITDGDRAVLYEYAPAAGLIRIPNPVLSTATVSLFGGAVTDPKARVTRIRITTPYRDSGTGTQGIFVEDDLRKVTLILEAESEVVNANVPKKRILQQKVLMIPGEDNSAVPLSGTDSAIVAGLAVAPNTTTMQVHWAPVIAKGSITIPGSNALTYPTTGPNRNNWVYNIDGSKYLGAGMSAGNGSNDYGVENWLKFRSASSLLSDATGNPNLFSNITGTVTDFFTQLQAGTITASPVPVSTANTVLAGSGGVSWQSTYSGTNWATNGAGTMWTMDNGSAVMGQGALVQNWSPVVNEVNTILGQFGLNPGTGQSNYDSWKTYAINNNGYIRPTDANGSGFVNNQGLPLYVTTNRTLTTANTGTPLTNINQLSMTNLLPAETNGGTNSYNVPDRILFVDTVQGTANGTAVSIQMERGFFWKGLFYVNGSVGSSGSGGSVKSLWMQNPTQFEANPGVPTGGNGYTFSQGNFLDGILYATGAVTCGANGGVYGSVITQSNYGAGGTPEVFYNSRLKNGLFVNNPSGSSSKLLAAAVTGPINELNAW